MKAKLKVKTKYQTITRCAISAIKKEMTQAFFDWPERPPHVEEVFLVSQRMLKSFPFFIAQRVII